MALKDRYAQRAVALDRKSAQAPRKKAAFKVDPNQDIRNRMQERLTHELNLDTDHGAMTEERKQEIQHTIDDVMESERVPAYLRTQVKEALFNEIVGYGPIQPLLDDPEITEIMVNGPGQVVVEYHGKLRQAEGVRFRDDNHVLQIIEKIVSPLGRRIDDQSPMVDARLPDGSRVNAIIPPLAIDGPSITVRKFAKDPLGIGDFLQFGTLSEKMAMFLRCAVEAKQNIVVSGGTGSGKTTLLNVLSSFIPSDERIVTIEDAAELHLQQWHAVRLETRKPNIEGRGEVSMRTLLRNALRMRPDRIIVGEVRGGEALDMLQAMNTGHEGSLTTLHANSPRDALSRIETMVLMAGMDLPLAAIRQQIASAVNLIIQQGRLQDGSRKVLAISEVTGRENDTITLQDIFRFEPEAVDERGRVNGQMKATGIRPRCVEAIARRGIAMPKDLFD